MTNRVTKFGEVKKEKSQGDGVALPFIVNNFLSLDGGEIKGNLDLSGNFIKNLPDPVDGQDAATKNYIDSSQGHSFFRRLPGRGYAAVKDLDMNENRLLNLGMPIDNREAANKLYTDITANDVKQSLEGHNPFYLNTDKHKARGSIDMLNFKVEGLPMPVDDKDAANKIYVDTLTEDRRKKLEINNPFNFDNGEYGAKNKINMKGNKIEGVGFPDLPEDVATVAYVDEANVWERKNGGFVAKDHIYLGRKKLGGLKDPTANGEAANKGYVDKQTEKIKEEIKQNNNPEIKDLVRISKNVFIIQATARGPFYQDETPFFFVNAGYAVDLNNLTEPEKQRLAFYFLPSRGKITGYFLEYVGYNAPFKFYIDQYYKPENLYYDVEEFPELKPHHALDTVKYKKYFSYYFNDSEDPTDGTIFYNPDVLIDALSVPNMCVKRKLGNPIHFGPCQCIAIRMDKTEEKEKGSFCTISLYIEFDDDDLFNVELEKVLINKNWDMKNNKIFNIADPAFMSDVANKGYVDVETEKIKDYVDEKTANIQPAGVDPAELDKIKTDLEKNQAFNTRNQKTFNARGNINMKQKTIRNIPDPVEITDAVPLGYVNELKEFFEDRIKEVEDKAKEAKDAADRAPRAQPGGGVNGAGGDFGDMKGRKLVNVGDPQNSGDGVNKKYVDQKTPFTKTNGYYSTTHGINVDFKKITNLGEPTADGDATNKKYIDDEINNIELGLLKRNGGFQAVDAIDMNSNRIKNVGAPQLYDDATNKAYVDNKVKPVEEQTETNRKGLDELRAFHVGESTQNKNMRGFKIVNVGQPTDEQDVTNKNYVDNQIKKYVDEETAKILPKERVYKFLGTSIILIRGEIEGPIIGIDEVKNINRRKPTINGGSISIDEKGNPVIPSIIYFGKNDGGEFSYDGKDGKIKIKPNFLFPYSGNIISCSYIFTYEDDDEKDENFELIFRLNEDIKRGNQLYDPNHEEQIDYSSGIIDSFGIKKEYKNDWRFFSNVGKILKTCVHPPHFLRINFTECASLIIYFKSSHPRVLKGIITLAVQIHLKNYNEDYLPDGFDI